jgi:hypothetical protein
MSMPPPDPPVPPGVPPTGPPPGYGVAPPPSSIDRIRMAWQGRAASDYVFNFWTALGWTLLSCGFYGFYVTYQLMRRSRDHNLRRIELLDAATAFAWQQAETRGLSAELQPNFGRISAELAVMRQKSTEFRDPVVWTLLSLLGGVVHVIMYIILDGDLVDHDRAEGAVESELASIYGRLGVSVPAPDPSRLKGRHQYALRVVVTFVTCGLYFLWWQYDVMTECNRHFEHNWRWEDGLVAAVQTMGA